MAVKQTAGRMQMRAEVKFYYEWLEKVSDEQYNGLK